MRTSSGPPGSESGNWVLVDAGLSISAPAILKAVAEWAGPESRPKAIVLTHGHFDHVGSLKALAEMWDVPVYAHRLELPYLTGQSKYPPPDPLAGGGMVALSSPLYSRGPFNFGDRVRPLPGDGSVPGMPGWQWIHTPGHAPGHVSFFREVDRFLIAGDAFVTTKQESAYSALTGRPIAVHGPPAYFTPDWHAAKNSVRALAHLRPEFAATGHGYVPKVAEIAAGSFKRRSPPQIRGSGYVVHTLEAALWAFHTTDNFRDGALAVVNLGEDADTTGAVFGQIAGAFYGESGIPAEWRAKLARRDVIESFADGQHELAFA
jgi:glyoxylase-like metal-dependent hydrolase (beta-lactamase superfamily II)